jgi:hypothetical protein
MIPWSVCRELNDRSWDDARVAVAFNDEIDYRVQIACMFSNHDFDIVLLSPPPSVCLADTDSN